MAALRTCVGIPRETAVSSNGSLRQVPNVLGMKIWIRLRGISSAKKKNSCEPQEVDLMGVMGIPFHHSVVDPTLS
jgi:hypothetical protein